MLAFTVIEQPVLILLRGLPGAGKTTFAHLISEHGKVPVFSIDDYFTDPCSGEYRFDFRKNHLAYEQCFNRTRNALLEGVEKVIVHNPFVLGFELKPYLDLAQDMNVRVFVLTVENYHGSGNVHDVPESSLVKMQEKFSVKLQ